MKINLEEARIYVRPGATDLRKGVSGLCSIIGNEMNLDALCGSAFLFCNKTYKLLKVIFWDKTGFWLAQKRLEKSTWPWPMKEEVAHEYSDMFPFLNRDEYKANMVAEEF